MQNLNYSPTVALPMPRFFRASLAPAGGRSASAPSSPIVPPLVGVPPPSPCRKCLEHYSSGHSLTQMHLLCLVNLFNTTTAKVVISAIDTTQYPSHHIKFQQHREGPPPYQ